MPGSCSRRCPLARVFWAWPARHPLAGRPASPGRSGARRPARSPRPRSGGRAGSCPRWSGVRGRPGTRRARWRRPRSTGPGRARTPPRRGLRGPPPAGPRGPTPDRNQHQNRTDHQPTDRPADTGSEPPPDDPAVPARRTVRPVVASVTVVMAPCFQGGVTTVPEAISGQAGTSDGRHRRLDVDRDPISRCYGARMRIGAHVRAGKGLVPALQHGADIGAEVIQIFTQSPRMWKPSQYGPEVLAAYREAQSEQSVGDGHVLSCDLPDQPGISRCRAGLEVAGLPQRQPGHGRRDGCRRVGPPHREPPGTGFRGLVPAVVDALIEALDSTAPGTQPGDGKTTLRTRPPTTKHPNPTRTTPDEPNRPDRIEPSRSVPDPARERSRSG